MKINKIDLIRRKDKQFLYSEDVDFSKEKFSKKLNVTSLDNVHVEGIASYDDNLELLTLDLSISGIMVIPCARTLEPVDYHFNTKCIIKYSFIDTLDEDAIIVNSNTIDTYPQIYDEVITEVPMVVYKEGTTPIVSSNEKEVDPRLAKLYELLK